MIAAMTTWTSACRPPTHALEGAGGDQLTGVLRESGDHRAEDEDQDRDLDQQLLVEQVGELAPDRGGGGRGEQGAGDHPGVLVLAAVQRSDDLRQGGGDDRGTEHRDEQDQQEAAERLQDLAVAHRLRLGVSVTVGMRGRGHAGGPPEDIGVVDSSISQTCPMRKFAHGESCDPRTLHW
jgi:hypothetical protein